MAQRPRFNHRKQKPKHAARAAPERATVAVYEKKPPVVHGKPFIVMEDRDKKTFEYVRGSWVPYAMTIAECRQDCLVKELPQKVNGMTRYEVRSPEPINS